MLHPPEEFMRHAADCELMAKSTKDPQSKATWKRMAERWRQCAGSFRQRDLEARSKRRARADSIWSGSSTAAAS